MNRLGIWSCVSVCSLIALVSSCSGGGSASCISGQTIACACGGGAQGTQVCQANGSYAACSCADAGAQLDLAGHDLAGKPPPGAKRVFVTSATYPADLRTAGSAATGIAGGDNLCANAAVAAALGGTWKVWLSDGTTNAIDRITDVGPWYRLDGEKVFNNKANMTTTALVAIDVTEQGTSPIGTGSVWTGTANGGQKTAHHCSAWTATGSGGDASQVQATVGTWVNGTGWTENAGLQFCLVPSTQAYRLYCIEQ